MFRITEDPSSGTLVECLTKKYKNDFIVSVDMDKVGVMAFISSEPHTHTHTTRQNMLP